MPFREIDQDLTQILWDRDQNTLAPLLRISSHADASSEPRWLVFFDYLAVAFREGASAKPSSGWAQEALQALAEQLWGPGALTADELAQAWFALPGGDQGQQPRWLAGRETADRAIAIAELAGRRLGLKNRSRRLAVSAGAKNVAAFLGQSLRARGQLAHALAARERKRSGG